MESASPPAAPDAARVPLRPYPYRMLRALAWVFLALYCEKAVVRTLQNLAAGEGASSFMGVPAFALMGACIFHLLRAAERIDAQAVRLCAGMTFARGDLEPSRWQVLLAMAPFCALGALQGMTLVANLEGAALASSENWMDQVLPAIYLLFFTGAHLAAGFASEELLLYLNRLAAAARYFPSGHPVRSPLGLRWPLGVLLLLWCGANFQLVATSTSPWISNPRVYLFTLCAALLASSAAVVLLAHAFDRVVNAWHPATADLRRPAWPGGGGRPVGLAVLGAAMLLAVTGTFLKYRHDNNWEIGIFPMLANTAICVLPWIAMRLDFRRLRAVWEILAAKGRAAQPLPHATWTVWAARLVPLFVGGMIAWRLTDLAIGRNPISAFFVLHEFIDFFVALAFASLVHEVVVMERLIARMADNAEKIATARAKAQTEDPSAASGA